MVKMTKPPSEQVEYQDVNDNAHLKEFLVVVSGELFYTSEVWDKWSG